MQTCEDGEVRWIQIPADGEDPFELDTPAPFVRLDEAAVTDETGSSSESTLAIALGAAGLAAGLAALGLVLARRPDRDRAEEG